MKNFILSVTLFAASLAQAGSLSVSFPDTCTASGSPNAVVLSCVGVTTPPVVPVPPPALPVDSCASQGLNNTTIPLAWGGGNLRAFQMNANQSYSFEMTIPPEGAGGQVSTVYGGNQKVISISASKCDFSPELALKNCLIGGNDPGVYYSTNVGRSCPVVPGKTYYVNLRNAVLNGAQPVRPIIDSCTSGFCQFSIGY